MALGAHTARSTASQLEGVVIAFAHGDGNLPLPKPFAGATLTCKL
jgi:hypothetical protein